MDPRRLILAGLLTLSLVRPASAQTFTDLWIHCTPGSLRACSHTEIGFTYATDPTGGQMSVLLVRMTNLQGLAGYDYGPRGFRWMTIQGLEGTPPQFGGMDSGQQAEHHASEGNATTGADLDWLDTGPPGSIGFSLDYGSYLYGCDLQPGELDAFASRYDQTCGGSVTYALTLRGNWHLGNSTSLTYIYQAWEDGAWAGSPHCTTSVDCVTVTPEPATMLLMATGLLGLGVVARRRRRGRFL